MKILNCAHLEDLKKSGLLDETILKAGIKSIPLDQLVKQLSFSIPNLISAYEIPYNKDFSRFKVFYSNNNNGKKLKYLQGKNTGNRLYIPSDVKPILNNPSTPLYITEGEKKALKATQEGFYCIGLSGLWNWSNGNKELIPDFDLITLKERIVYIVPDNDYKTANKNGYKKNLKKAVNEFAEKLKARKAIVSIVELPEGELKGLDDYLCNHTIEEFKRLPVTEVKSLSERITEARQEDIQNLISEITNIESEIEQSLYIQKLSKKLGVSKRAIQKDIKTIEENESKTSETQTVISANFQGLVDLVVDDNDNVAYLIKDSNKLQVATVWKVNKTLHIPPNRENIPFQLSRASEVIKHYQLNNNQKLFEDIIAYLKRFSYLSDRQWILITSYVFLTYIQNHPDIHYLPIILLYAVPERGKTRTGKAIIYISFRGIHLVDLREANLFRFSQNLGATLFFDIMNLWKKAEKNGAEDILLLRCEKGAKATRVIYPEKGAFEDTRYYDVYGATVIATNEPIHKILDTRCIFITMPNKPQDYENPIPEKAQELKERLTAERARIMNAPLPNIETIQGLNGRLWDISKPLLQVCKMVYPDGFNNLVDALLEIAGQRIENKKASIEGQIISILYELSPDNISEWTLKTSDVLEKLNETRPERWKISSQYFGKKLNAMGLQTKIIMGYSKIQLNKEDFKTLLIQYGFNNISSYIPQKTLLNSTKVKEQGISTVCDSRELVESERNSTETLLAETLKNKGLESLVESSREFGGMKKEIIIEGEL